MSSEKLHKQLLLIGGIVTAFGAVIGAATDVLKKIASLFGDIDKLPPGAFWLAYIALFVFGLWLVMKWRTRHSRLMKPEALRLDRNNPQHLVGRIDDVENLFQQCLAKQMVFLEGESGSGKSALVRSGLLPRLKDERSILPLILSDLWVDHWERGPFQALKMAMANCGAFTARPLLNLADVEQELVRFNEEQLRTPLIIFDQFDDYQARNLERFLANRTWLDPATLRRENPFWSMVARLLEKDKLRCLFVTRSDTAAGLTSVQFLGPVQAFRLDRVPSQYIAGLLRLLSEGKPEAPVIVDPERGWNQLCERIISDIGQQNVVLPQQLKIMLGGIQSLKPLNIAHYERVGGATGVEALYVEQQISGTARKVGLEAGQIRAMLVDLVDPLYPAKTRSRPKAELATAAAKISNRAITTDSVDRALEELERGEMVRSASDTESRLTTYQLDHDYLTRGVLAADRRANRWHYLLQDGAKALANAGSLATQWKALLPTAVQCRLVWERLKGTFRYGQQRNYALVSLARFAPAMLILAAISLGWQEFSRDTPYSNCISLISSTFTTCYGDAQQGFGDKENCRIRYTRGKGLCDVARATATSVDKDLEGWFSIRSFWPDASYTNCTGQIWRSLFTCMVDLPVSKLDEQECRARYKKNRENCDAARLVANSVAEETEGRFAIGSFRRDDSYASCLTGIWSTLHSCIADLPVSKLDEQACRARYKRDRQLCEESRKARAGR
jgi:hypothetical protein